MLLPGVTTPARLVASVREVANQRLWDTLYGLLSPGQRAVLDSLLTVPPGARVSELDRLRRGPVRISGPQMNQMKGALERAEEIAAFGMGGVDVSAIPPRRLAAPGHAAGHRRAPDVPGGRRSSGPSTPAPCERTT